MLIDVPLILPRKKDLTVPTSASSAETTLKQKTQATGLPLVRDSLTRRGISTRAAKVILQSWRASPQKQYQTYHQRWRVFCSSRGVNPLSASLEDG